MSVSEPPVKKKRGAPPGSRAITSDDRAIAQKLARFRVSSGMTQTDLAKKVGVTFQQIQKYEQATNRIAAGTIVRLARALNVSPAAFYEESDLIVTEELKIDPQTRKLMVDFGALAPAKRQMVLSLAKSLAQDSKGDAS